MFLFEVATTMRSYEHVKGCLVGSYIFNFQSLTLLGIRLCNSVDVKQIRYPPVDVQPLSLLFNNYNLGNDKSK